MKPHVPAIGLGWAVLLVALIATIPSPLASAPLPAPALPAAQRPITALASDLSLSSVEFAPQQEGTPAAPILLQGTFAVQHIDDYANGLYTRAYLLSRADGLQVPLTVDEAWLASAGGYRRFEGEEVVIAVAPPTAAASAANGEPAYILTGVQLVAGEPPLDDPHQGKPGAEFEGPTALRYVNLLCRFPDVAVTPPTAATIDGWFSSAPDNFGAYFHEVSGGRLDFSFTTAAEWKTLPFRYADYTTTSARLNALTQTCPGLFASTIDFSLYDGVQFFTNADWGSSLGSQRWPVTIGSGQNAVTHYLAVTWLSYFFADQYAHDVLVHELGHTLGEPHSNHEAEAHPYDNLWDVMSGHACGASGGPPPGGGCLAQDFISDHKLNQGWLLPNRIFTLSGAIDTTINLDWLATPSATGYKVVSVPIGPGHYFTLEARRKQATGYDRALRGSGLVIHEVLRTGRPEPAWQVSALRTASSESGAAVWLPGESYVNHTHQFAVQVLSESASGYRLRLVRGPLVSPNGPALATSMTADSSQAGGVTLAVHVANGGSTLAHGAGFELSTLTAPAGGGLGLVGATGASCSVGIAGRISCALAPITPGGSASFSLMLKPQAAGSYSVAGAAYSNSTEVETSDNQAQTSFTATAAPDLVTKIDPAFLQWAGTDLAPKAHFTNTGATAVGVTMQVTVPLGFHPVGAMTMSSAPGIACQWIPQGYRCALPQMAPGAFVQVTLTVRADDEPSAGAHALTAAAWVAAPGGEYDAANSRAQSVICVGVCAPVTPMPQATSTPPPAGNPLPTPLRQPTATPDPRATATPTPPGGPASTPAAPMTPTMSVYLPAVNK
ncbi:MAG: hypothetical protein ACRC1H_18840 [Caldilineaceae bacterium]